jgi:hypothetical protein
MDCLNTFTLNIFQNFTIDTPKFITWNTSNNYHPWAMQIGEQAPSVSVTDFNIQGFKNIDFYGVTMIGNCYPTIPTASRQGLVEDWGIDLNLTGSPSLIGGNFGTNNFGFTQGSNRISLSKYQNDYKLESPIGSVTQIQIINFNASGIQAEANTGIELTFDVTLIIHYKFEGE